MKTIKTFLFLFLSVIPLSIFALSNPASLSECELQGSKYGNGKSDDEIGKECVHFFSKVANRFAKKVSSDGKTTVIGYKSIIFIKNESKLQIIAGNMTGLDTIKALAYDEKNNEIVVLESSGDVLFFSSIITGNVSPYRILQNAELSGGDDLVVDTAHNEVIVSNRQNGRILFFSRLANISAPSSKRFLSLIKSIDGFFKGRVSMTISLKSPDLYILDIKHSILYKYNLNASDELSSPVEVLNQDSISIKKPISIKYSLSKDAIIISNDDDKEMYY